MIIEVINTGSELLLGSVINSHLAFLGDELFGLGLRIERQVCVPDGLAIRMALEEAFPRCQVLIVTGGLGPTSDDLTRDIAAELLRRDLQTDAGILDAIRQRFRRRGLDMPARVERQAQVPHGARVLPNLNGTAPGLYLPATPETPHLFLLPGPPRELRPMFRDSVLPILQKIRPADPGIVYRNYRVAGLGESQVEELIAADLETLPDLEIGYCARPGEVDVRLIGPQAPVTQGAQVLRARLGENIFAEGDAALESVVVQALVVRGTTLSVAESCTGGFLANRITNVPGASEVFVDGVVTYANAAKTRLLGVPPEMIETHGAVSRPVAAAMAEGARLRSQTGYALSTTGIAGPGGGTETKPVGTVFIGLASEGEQTVVEHRRYASDRETFKWLVTQTALDLLRRRLGTNRPGGT